MEEGRRLKPLLSPDEWREKQKEFTQRAAVILHRTKQMLEAENAAMDAELEQKKQKTPQKPLTPKGRQMLLAMQEYVRRLKLEK